MSSKHKVLISMKWGDFVLIGIVLVMCLSLWAKLAAGLLQTGKEASIVVLGEVIMKVDLISQKNTFTLTDFKNKVEAYSEDISVNNTRVLHIVSQGIHFDLEFANGKVRFEKSDCPDKICVHTGFISKPGQITACIPAQVLVKIIGESQNGEIDVIIK